MATFLYVCDVMRIIAKSTLKKYWEDNPQTESSLLEWLDIVYDCEWETPNEVKATFGNASLVGNNRVIFNIKGNDHRLITKIDYQNKIVFTLWIGTRSEYDKIDAKIIEYVKTNKN
jgi:mRNA interferase HigB